MIKSTSGKTKDFNEQARRSTTENVTCDRDRKKKTKEAMLNVLTERARASHPEPDMKNFTTCKDNHVPNINFNTNYANGNTILPNKRNVNKSRDHLSVLCQPVEATEKAIAFIKDNIQYKLDDSSWDFTRRSNSAESE